MSWKYIIISACFYGSAIGTPVMAGSDPFKTTLDVEQLETKNFTNRRPKADIKPPMVILHYTGLGDKRSQECLTTGGVSSHYLIKSNAKIYQIVLDSKRAWHAGVSSWNKETDMNSLSLGIEIVNYGYVNNLVPESVDTTSCIKIDGTPEKWFYYSEEQIQSIGKLMADMKKRLEIQDRFFLGHSDIAPGRKVDPGPLFPWERLHKEFGVGAWPDLEQDLKYVDLPEAPSIKWTQDHLCKYGYKCPINGQLDKETISVLKAFQMHFRPDLIDGKADKKTNTILAHLVDQYNYEEI